MSLFATLKHNVHATAEKQKSCPHLILPLLPEATVVLHVTPVELQDLVGIVADEEFLRPHVRAQRLPQRFGTLLEEVYLV